MKEVEGGGKEEFWSAMVVFVVFVLWFGSCGLLWFFRLKNGDGIWAMG